MNKNLEDTPEVLSLTLKTPESAADAAVVASMLRMLMVLIQETKETLKIDGKFSIRVIPFKEGSLEIPIHLYLATAGVASSLFTFNPGLEKVLETIKSVFELKKHLKGDAASDEVLRDKSIIGDITINGNNNVITIIQQQRVEEVFDTAAQDLEQDESITGVRIVNKSTGKEITSITREEFKYLRSANNENSNDVPQDRIRTIDALLTIHSPVLQGAAKWKFMYEGRQISASIRDEEFLKEVSNGVEAFRNGDRLNVVLEVGERYVASIQDYERSGQYSINRVIQHIPRPDSPKQLTLIEQSINQE